MKSGVIAAVVVAFLVAVGVFVFLASDDSEDTASTNESSQIVSETTQPSTANETSTPTETIEESTQQSLKADEVAQRNTADECWTIIDGNVYDITEYLPRHPGGNTILAACGTDGSSLFNERQTESGESVGSGTPHSSRASSQLAGFQIGMLDTAAE